MRKFNNYCKIICLAFLPLYIQCKNSPENEQNTKSIEERQEDGFTISQIPFGITSNGENVEKYTLKHSNGLEMSVISFGGIITELKVPDKAGNYSNVVLSLDSLSIYENGSPYFGAIIGRYGNRIAKGKFEIDGEEFQLETNDGQNHLHGGVKGFDKIVWDVTSEEGIDSASLTFKYLSKDGEGGYPGNLNTTVTYILNANNSLDFKYEATTDKKTVVNLTQHSYFNLSGDFSTKITDHIVEINADEYLPVDKTLIPTGELVAVENSPFDFSEPTVISKGLEMEGSNDQLDRGPGFDHCWVLNNQNGDVSFAASAYEPDSGRFMEVFTNEPALQFYIGNFLDGSLPSPEGGNYARRTGFCMETQHFPDSPNQKDFPSVILEPGNTYTSQTSYKFSVK